MPPAPSFRESNLFGTPIRNLGLVIAGTRLEPIVREFEQELAERGITRLKPRFHLSTEWGVPFGTVVIGILGGLIGGALFHAATGDDSSAFEDFDLGSVLVAFVGAAALLLVLQAVGLRGRRR